MNCPNCGKEISGETAGKKTSRIKRASSTNVDSISPDAWNGYLEINRY